MKDVYISQLVKYNEKNKRNYNPNNYMIGASVPYSRNGLLNLFLIFVAVLSISLIATVSIGSDSVYGVEFFSRDDAPFGKSYDDWISEYWNWWLDAAPKEKIKPPGCLVHESGLMVMLMQTAAPPGGTNNHVCDISAEQGIMVPLWSAWCDEGVDLDEIRDPSVDLDKKLTDCARTTFNLGRIGSEIKVDDVRVANLNVIMSLNSGKLDYKINTLQNVSEIYSKGFNLTVPEDTNLPNLNPGEWRAGSHGWWAFLEPLPPGKHTIYYNVRVFPTGAVSSPGVNPTTTDVTYTMNVK